MKMCREVKGIVMYNEAIQGVESRVSGKYHTVVLLRLYIKRLEKLVKRLEALARLEEAARDGHVVANAVDNIDAIDFLTRPHVGGVVQNESMEVAIVHKLQ